ncbi:MAG: hypothetical protein CMJ90_05695 [Planctomycetes bacterium]|nr:hypothetical protein [Planctomycetota bacterium]
MQFQQSFGLVLLSCVLCSGGISLRAQELEKRTATKATGRIVGHTILAGKVRKNRPLDMKCDPNCDAANAGRKPYTQRVLVDDKGNLANVVVWIKDVPDGEYPAKRGRMILDQVACRYVPHVLGIQIGQKLRIRNSDATCHTVHFKSKLNGDWNMTQASKGTSPPRKDFAKAEVGTAVFKCDVHPWMTCRVAIFDHPFFAVSERDGSFEIPTHNLPAGKYEIWAWHETYGRTKLKDVDLQPGERVPLTLTYK